VTQCRKRHCPLQHHLTAGPNDNVRSAAAVLLAAIASRNPETHAFIALQSGTPAIILRLLQARETSLPLLDAALACLSVCSGVHCPRRQYLHQSYSTTSEDLIC